MRSSAQLKILVVRWGLLGLSGIDIYPGHLSVGSVIEKSDSAAAGMRTDDRRDHASHYFFDLGFIFEHIRQFGCAIRVVSMADEYYLGFAVSTLDSLVKK